MNARGRALLAGLALATVLPAAPAWGLRANLRQDLQRMEEMGHYEEVLFFRRSTLDMILAVHAAWSGAPYDPAMDGLYTETRVDRRYLNIVNGQKRAVTALLEKARLTPAQAQTLESRVRVYVEGHLSPDFDEMGNFYFRRKAWCMERTGLFHDASFRRHLTGYYCRRVCGPYYATAAEELRSRGEDRLAGAYEAAGRRWLDQARLEFRRCNGDRVLAGLRPGAPRTRLGEAEVVATCRKGLESAEADARLAAAMALADLGRSDLVKPLADDADPDVRAAARAAGESPSRPGLRPGILARYFDQPGQARPAAEKVLPAADIGLTGNERFPDPFRGVWQKDSVLGPQAAGQFRLTFAGKLDLPTDGRWRFYVKTDGDNRATVRVGGAVVISPANDAQRLYSIQTDARGGALTRVDFSAPVALNKGLADLEIDYRGAQAKGPFGPAGLRLYWSSDDRVMEPVPPTAFLCDGK